jgi:hypothetical protein
VEANFLPGKLWYSACFSFPNTTINFTRTRHQEHQTKKEGVMPNGRITESPGFVKDNLLKPVPEIHKKAVNRV